MYLRALNGGVPVLGLFCGRTEPNGPKNPKTSRCLALAKEWFREANGKHAVCCRGLTKEFDMGRGEHREQCIRFTGLCAGKVAEIAVRELNLTDLDRN